MLLFSWQQITAGAPSIFTGNRNYGDFFALFGHLIGLVLIADWISALKSTGWVWEGSSLGGFFASFLGLDAFAMPKFNLKTVF